MGQNENEIKNTIFSEHGSFTSICYKIIYTRIFVVFEPIFIKLGIYVN